MQLKTKLVLSLSALTCAIVLVLSTLFVSELLRQRIEQTVAANEVLSHEVLLMTRQAVEAGLRAQPPIDRSDEALHAAVTDALRSNSALADVMNAVVRYSPTVQDVSVTDAHGIILLSTDPDALDQQASYRNSLSAVRDGGIAYQTRQVFGKPRVFDSAQTLVRNGQPFLIVHVGVLSTFLRNSYAPWLKAALLFAGLAGLASIIAAGLLANLALFPIEQISQRLEHLTLAEGIAIPLLPGTRPKTNDAVVRVTRTIDRLDQQIRSTEAGYSALQANLNQMLDTLRDGVLLFTADHRSIMVSDAVAYFLNLPEDSKQDMVGLRIEEIFHPETALGAAVLEAFASGRTVNAETVTLEDGRQVQITLDRIDDGHDGNGSLGTLLTLRDTQSALQLGQELEVARRLAAIGKLTAGVGHEVKNPINAMVVHLELLRAKIAAAGNGACEGAHRHVEILAGEMQRLDRVVQTLADFSRPMELHLHEQDLRQVVAAVLELMGAELAENNVQVLVQNPHDIVPVRIDAELIRQALLNLFLNAMQAMPTGGELRILIKKDQHFATVQITDTGEGIPPELLPRIFELYFTTKPTGSGIGLATTYRILQMHGGAMDVLSNTDHDSPQRGTTFTLRVPLTTGIANDSRKVVTTGSSRG